ncbi:MAG: hypothetical protein ACTS7I_00935 [Candidatus Hodgkinia cicadicola]
MDALRRRISITERETSFSINVKKLRSSLIGRPSFDWWAPQLNTEDGSEISWTPLS